MRDYLLALSSMLFLLVVVIVLQTKVHALPVQEYSTNNGTAEVQIYHNYNESNDTTDTQIVYKYNNDVNQTQNTVNSIINNGS